MVIGLISLVVLVAGIAALNIAASRHWRSLTPAQRAEQDEENKIWNQIGP